MPDDFSRDLCDEKHRVLNKEIDVLFAKIKTVEAKMWAIILLLIANLAATVARLV